MSATPNMGYFGSIQSLLFDQFETRCCLNWPFGKLYQVSLLIGVYLLFANKWGPQFMSGRRPFDLKWPMVIYNFAMVAVNAYFHYRFFVWLDGGRQIFNFVHPDLTDSTEEISGKIQVLYFYYLSKYADLVDTVFFVLRKKYSHVSFLHLYHHAVVPFCGWYVQYSGNAHVPGLTLGLLFNTMIHSVMYSYYGLSALGPVFKKYLWWKKYVTQLQIAQFAIMLLYGCYCIPKLVGYSMGPIYFGIFQGVLFLVLFLRFYKRAYIKNDKK